MLPAWLMWAVPSPDSLWPETLVRVLQNGIDSPPAIMHPQSAHRSLTFEMPQRNILTDDQCQAESVFLSENVLLKVLFF